MFPYREKILLYNKNMEKPDSPDYTQPYLSQDLLLKMQSQTRGILDAAVALLEGGTVEDEVDREKIEKAAAFIENPTENLSDIMGHTTFIGHVMFGYMTQGEEYPPEIDALNGYLIALQCINRISFIEGEFAQGSPDSSKIQEAIALGSPWAKRLSKWYDDDAFLNTFNELRDRLGNLS